MKLSCGSLDTSVLIYKELPSLVQSFELPVIVSSEGKLIISGLCSVLRYIVHTAQHNMGCLASFELANCLKNLLGLRQNCLRACAEVSEWTMYTEVTLPQLVETVLSNSYSIGSDPPAELLQLENQLAKPPVEPSCKRNKKQSGTGKSSVSPTVSQDNTAEQESECENRTVGVNECLCSDSLTCGMHKNMLERFDNLQMGVTAKEICQRQFVEGNNIQLTDLVLFVCIHLLFNIEDIHPWCSRLPRLVSWFQRMAADPDVKNAVICAGLFECCSFEHCIAQRSVSNESPAASSSDTTLKSVEDEQDSSASGSLNSTLNSVHTKLTVTDQNCIQHTEKNRFHASQALVDATVTKATEMGLMLDVLPFGNGRCLQLPWEQYPSWVLPCGLGGVPDKRATRKLQQLENIVAGVKEQLSARSANSEASVVVDFCAGGGHVGILLAYLFPCCKVQYASF